MIPRPSRSNFVRVLSPGFLILALLAAGCSQHKSSGSDSLQPESSAGSLLAPIPPGGPEILQRGEESRLHMPLAIGNSWDYVIHSRVVIVAPEFTDEVTSESFLRSTIIGQLQIDGQEYFMQEEYDPNIESPYTNHFALRQDRSGLYSKDLVLLGGTDAVTGLDEAIAARLESSVSTLAARSPHQAAINAAVKRVAARLALIRLPRPGSSLLSTPGQPPPPRAPGSFEDGTFQVGEPLPGEIALLRYPISLGSGWIVRDSPRFARFVTARERLTVPAGEFAAWEMRGTSELYGPQDQVTFWYAREGLIKVELRVMQDILSWEGRPTGHLDYHWVQELTDHTLDSPLR